MISRQNLRSVALAAACVVLPAASFAQIRPSLPPDSPFGGGVPQGVTSSDTVSLSIAEVIKRALEHNLGVLLAEEGASGAAGARTVALSDLLPQVSGSVSEARRKTNLEAFGFPLREEFPRIVGPFNVFDARLFLSQAVLDLSAANGLRAAEHSLDGRPALLPQREGSRRARRRESLPAGARDRRPCRHRSRATRNGHHAAPAGDEPQRKRTRGRDRRRTRRGQAQHRASARDCGDQRLREDEAAAGARHRLAHRADVHAQSGDSSRSGSRDDSGGSAGAGLPRPAGLPCGPRASAGSRGVTQSDSGRGAFPRSG